MTRPRIRARNLRNEFHQTGCLLKIFGHTILMTALFLYVTAASSPVSARMSDQDPRVTALRQITSDAVESSTEEERQNIKMRVHTILVTMTPDEQAELLTMLRSTLDQALMKGLSHTDRAMGAAWASIFPLIGFTLAAIDTKSKKLAGVAGGLSVLSFALFSYAGYESHVLHRNVLQLRQGLQELAEAFKNEARAEAIR